MTKKISIKKAKLSVSHSENTNIGVIQNETNSSSNPNISDNIFKLFEKLPIFLKILTIIAVVVIGFSYLIYKVT